MALCHDLNFFGPSSPKSTEILLTSLVVAERRQTCSQQSPLTAPTTGTNLPIASKNKAPLLYKEGQTSEWNSRRIHHHQNIDNKVKHQQLRQSARDYRTTHVKYNWYVTSLPPAKMPYSTACTGPMKLCPECKPIYARLVREAYNKFEVADVFPSERVYPIGFAKKFPLEVPSKATLGNQLCKALRGTHPDPRLHWLITRSKDSKGHPYVKVFVLVDVEDGVKVTKELMHEIFAEVEGGGVKGWKYEVFGDIQECQTLQRLLFLQHKLLRK
ncbi:hypothetical protein BDW74DRAFT_16886 [Aspergillus multicolor]|uniref:uncharacterized protein n=1 Tax=Aspergillus multicolor TaxID=41759 RepID=UPI003CCD1672